MKLTIGKFAKKFHLSRSTLLYYDQIGLISPSGRTESGYRIYNEKDVNRMEKICEYRDAGLSLEDIKIIIHSEEAPMHSILEKRFIELGKEIKLLKSQQSVLAALIQTMNLEVPKQKIDRDLWVELFRHAGIDELSMRKWHQAFEANAPEKHHLFLQSLGFSEKEIMLIRKGGII